MKIEDITRSSDKYNLDFVNPKLFSENSGKDDLFCFFKADYSVANILK